MPNPNYTEADLADLTPEERSAIEAEAGDNADILNELADGDDGTAAAPAAAPAADGTATPGAEGADGAAAPAAPAPYTADVDPAKLQADLDAEKKAITDARAEETEALRKLNDGEIDITLSFTPAEAAVLESLPAGLLTHAFAPCAPR